MGGSGTEPKRRAGTMALELRSQLHNILHPLADACN